VVDIFGITHDEGIDEYTNEPALTSVSILIPVQVHLVPVEELYALAHLLLDHLKVMAVVFCDERDGLTG